MDGLKLKSWRENFDAAAQHLQIELDSFFKTRRIDTYYRLQLDEVGQSLSLDITDDTLPSSIREKLMKLFMDTRPEDSI